MTIEYINPNKLAPDILSYALGQTNNFPNIVGAPKKQITDMLRMRKSFLRNQLRENPDKAYALPDFNELMAEEIWQYAKHDLRPMLFNDWEAIIRQTPRFQNIFNHESAQLYRDYQDAISNNRSFIKHRYLSITAKRKAFAHAVRNPYILGEIELACTGVTTYGRP